jgi:uncharacterized protein (DUF58 family)
MYASRHRCPYYGYSVEFVDHREYTTGDEPRTIDWKMYARTDRYYVKEFEADTNTNLVVFLDVSRSMLYGSKLQYATTLAACLAYFSSLQRDRVGLATFANSVVDFVPPSAKHLRLVLHSLDHAERLVPKQPASPTRLKTIFQRLSDVVRRRSMVAIISDFYEEPDDVVSAINMLRGRGNDIMALHVLEPSERTFPFTESSNFVDLESDEKMPVIPEYLREGYQKVIADHIITLGKRLAGQGVDYAHFDTSQPMDKALFAYLGARSSLERTQRVG